MSETKVSPQFRAMEGLLKLIKELETENARLTEIIALMEPGRYHVFHGNDKWIAMYCDYEIGQADSYDAAWDAIREYVGKEQG